MSSPVSLREGDWSLRETSASDAYPLHYRRWSASAPRGRVLLFNGVMSHSLWLAPLGAALQEAGFDVIGADRRGSGPNPASRGDAPSGEQLLADVRAILAAEVTERGPLPLHLVGWCFGAILAVHLAGKLEHERLVLLAPGIYPTETLKTRMAVQERAGPQDQPSLVSPIDERMFTDGPLLEGFVLRDPERLERMSPRFHALSVRLSMLAAALLPRVPRPTLVLLAEHDEATDNPATLRALERAPAERFSVATIAGARHGLLFDAPEEVARRVIAHLSAGEER